MFSEGIEAEHWLKMDLKYSITSSDVSKFLNVCTRVEMVQINEDGPLPFPVVL